MARTVTFISTTIPGRVLHITKVKRITMAEKFVPGRDFPYRKKRGGMGGLIIIQGETESKVADEATLWALAGQEGVLDLGDDGKRYYCTLVDPRFDEDGKLDTLEPYELTFSESGSGNTLFLGHFDGANGSHAFVDSSHFTRPVSYDGHAQISTAQSKFGGSSLLLDGVDDDIKMDDSPDWAFRTAPLGIGMWIRPHTLPGVWEYRTLLAQYDNDPNSIQFTISRYGGASYYLRFCSLSGGSGIDFSRESPGMAVDTWYYIELDRYGNNWYIFQDGMQVGATEINSFSIPDLSSTMRIGSISGWGGCFNGYIDDAIIVRGVPMHTSNFVVPTVAFDPDDY